jgi:Glycosyl transferase family 2.
MSESLGIVIPAFRPSLERLQSYVEALVAEINPDHIRIELDDPTPITRQSCVEALEEGLLPDCVTVATVSERRGKGAALTAGFEALCEAVDVLAFADADGSTPASSVSDIIERVRRGETHIATGSRRHPEATVATHQTFARRHLGDIFAWTVRRVLDTELFDYQCGAKAFSAEVWQQIRPYLYEAGFAWDIEVIAVAAAFEYTIQEVPVHWDDRPGSTVSPIRTSMRLARALVAAHHRANIIRERRLDRLLAMTRPTRPALVDRLTPTEVIDRRGTPDGVEVP